MVSKNNSLLQVDIKGAQELADALRALGDDRLIKATLKRALLKAAQPMVEDARRRAPHPPGLSGESTGRMASKIAASTTLSKRQRRGRGRSSNPDEAFVYVGTAPKGPGVLTEFGTKERHHKSGKSVGSAPAQPFMRPAWEAHKEQILKDFTKMLWTEIEKSAKRLAKRQAKKAGIK